MTTSLRKLSLSFLALPALLLASLPARAADPCGKFDLANGIDCHIEVKGGCQANCTPLKFTAQCDGGCTAMATQTCSGDCETTCVQQCDPNHLDCIAGCHTECEQPFITECQQQHPERDCVEDAKASCTMHCRSACGVTVDSCLQHCQECCGGACTSSVNMDCDLKCFAELEGGCNVQCEAPSGALFCNGQYVYASDVEQCIQWLATQGIDVNVEARGQVTCDLSGCNGDGSANVGGFGCSASPGQSSPFATMGITIGLAAMGIAAARRRKNKSQ